jgi:hypothetical protein
MLSNNIAVIIIIINRYINLDLAPTNFLFLVALLNVVHKDVRVGP